MRGPGPDWQGECQEAAEHLKIWVINRFKVGLSLPRQEMGACLLEVRAWQLDCSVTNSFSYAGHESNQRHERHEEAVGSGRGDGGWAKRLLKLSKVGWAAPGSTYTPSMGGCTATGLTRERKMQTL